MKTWSKEEVDKRIKKLSHELFNKTKRTFNIESRIRRTEISKLGKDIVNLSRATSNSGVEREYGFIKQSKSFQFPMKAGFLICRSNQRIIKEYDIQKSINKNVLNCFQTNRNIKAENRLKETIKSYLKHARSHNAT